MFSQKRGQSTLFIAIGLVIVIIIALVFYFRGVYISGPGEGVPFSNKVEEIKAFTQSCIVDGVKDGLVSVNAQAGYYNNADKKDSEGHVYVFYNGEKEYIDPDDPLVLLNIENAVKDRLDDCLDGFGVFNKQGYTVRKNGEETFEIILNEDNTIVDINYPVLIMAGGETAELFDDFESVIVYDNLKRNLDNVKSTVDNYLNDLESDPEEMCGGVPDFSDLVQNDPDNNDLSYWEKSDDEDFSIKYKFIFVFDVVECADEE